jgi:peptidoglycan hydrolase-like protein with peptidoglycan-binding domain
MANVLKKGSKGDAVKQLQQDLVTLGYTLNVDGDFGSNTESAVMQLQKAFGYNVDGIVGDATLFLINQQIGLGWKANR